MLINIKKKPGIICTLNSEKWIEIFKTDGCRNNMYINIYIIYIHRDYIYAHIHTRIYIYDNIYAYTDIVYIICLHIYSIYIDPYNIFRHYIYIYIYIYSCIWYICLIIRTNGICTSWHLSWRMTLTNSWDFDIRTDHLISTRRPDLIIINKNPRKTYNEDNLRNCGLCCTDWARGKIERK